MHDHVRLRLGDGARDGVGIEGVRHGRAGALAADEILLGRGAREADDLVAAPDELGDEDSSQCARGAGDEDLHDWLLDRVRSPLLTGCPGWL
jgi:hypothetical protein